MSDNTNEKINRFVKFSDLVPMLKDGWEIYTRRGSAPYEPLYFDLYKDNHSRKRVHHKTIEKLINDKVINGTSKGHNKYKLRE